MALLVMSVLPTVFAAGTGGSLGGGVVIEEFEPMVFQCGERVLVDDEIQPWRITEDGIEMTERAQNYLFEGERYQVEVLVFDKNKIQDNMVDLVLEGEEYCTTECVDDGTGTCVERETCIPFDDYEVNCVETSLYDYNACNARIDEETLSWDSETMQGYTCTIDILDSEHMYGTYWMKVKSTSGLTDEEGVYDEIARWFINPMISLSVDGDLDFDEIRPGTASYSTVLLENTAEGGVLLDMFVTGKDWPAADTNLGRCANVDDATGLPVAPTQYVNYLPLGAFRYYAENGAYSTRDDAVTNAGVAYNIGFVRNSDAEGYVNIQKQLNAGFEEAMFDDAEVIQAGDTINGAGYSANVLYPGSAGMSVTFRLMLPEPCYGEFESESDGSIFFWGEAI
ncbi:hypothetical protein HOE04_04315 [archaeon]|nr:hypothetical protein [archaeon]